MKQPKPLPTGLPFLTIYTPTHLRPEALARNMASIGRQTAVEDIEQIVIPDHVGYGLAGGLYGRIPWYAKACRGTYITVLGDDDQLVDDTVVAKLKKAVSKHQIPPPVVTVRVRKGDREFPAGDPNAEPVEGDVDLGCYMLRRDVWLSYKDCYGIRYQGDFDHALRLFRDGWKPVPVDLLFSTGPLSNGRPELSL